MPIFLVSTCGAASTLLAMNAAYAAAGRSGGFYELADAAAVDPEIATAALDGNEFIFDVQGHFVEPGRRLAQATASGCKAAFQLREVGLRARGRAGQTQLPTMLKLSDEFIKDVFMDSDTDMMVLSFVPSRRAAEPLTIEEAAATAEIVERMEGTHRLLIHGRVNPNQDGDMQGMDELAERWKVSAWKTYTQWGPDGKGYFFGSSGEFVGSYGGG